MKEKSKMPSNYIFRLGEEAAVGNSTAGFQGVFGVTQTPNGPVYVWYDAAQGTGLMQVGDEIISLPQVNGWPSAVYANGKVYITWTDDKFGLDGAGNGIFIQAVDPKGDVIGDVIQVNTKTEGNQVFSQATVLEDGNIVVTWHDYGRDNDDSDGVHSFARIYDPVEKEWTGDQFAVDDLSGRHLNPKAVALPDGGFTIVWTGYEYAGAPANGAMLVRAFDSDGSPRGDAAQINQNTNYDGAFVQQGATLSDGTVVYAWRSDADGSQDGESRASVRLYDEDGVTPLKGEYQIELPDHHHGMSPVVTALPDGGFLAVFVAIFDQFAAGVGEEQVYSIFAMRFDEKGNPMGDLLTVAEAPVGSRYFYAEVAVSDQGEIVVIHDVTNSSGDTDIVREMFTVGEKLLLGTDGDDVLRGTAGDTVVDGKGGNDTIWAGKNDAGNDTLFGGAGNDTLGLGEGKDIGVGGDGSDVLFGGDGSDLLIAGDWNDTNNDGSFRPSEVSYADRDSNTIWAGDGNDTVYGDGGHDTLGGGYGHDKVYGREGDDLIFAGKDGNDLVDGGSGDDTVYGGIGKDTVKGGSGDDVLFGGEGNDIVNGGAGNDTLYGGIGNDTLIGGDGVDQFYFNKAEGDNVIQDFGSNDTLFLVNTETDFTSLSDIKHASAESGAGVLIQLGNGATVLLEGVTLSDLDDLNIVF